MHIMCAYFSLSGKYPADSIPFFQLKFNNVIFAFNNVPIFKQ